MHGVGDDGLVFEYGEHGVFEDVVLRTVDEVEELVVERGLGYVGEVLDVWMGLGLSILG